MQAAAYDRARKLWTPRRGAVLWAKILGVLHSLLVIKAILIGGAVAALVASRGEFWHAPLAEGERPGWLNQTDATDMHGRVRFVNEGLWPIVVANEGSSNPIHRATARCVRIWLRWVPALRENQGALLTLLASGLGVFFALSIVGNLRRSAIAGATQEVAGTLRRQIHRQLYRLGQSSLPAEGTGPVMGLFTREVNDIREGLAAGPRRPVPFARADRRPDRPGAVDLLAVDHLPRHPRRPDLARRPPSQPLGRARLRRGHSRGGRPALPAPGRLGLDPGLGCPGPAAWRTSTRSVSTSTSNGTERPRSAGS